MKGIRILIGLITFSVFLTGVFIFKPTTEAYNNTITHPLLTQKIAELYNAIYDPDLTEEEIQSLMAGSADEDTPPRWINHFYDPTTGLGWSGERLGSISSIDVLTAAISAFNKDPEPAVSWVQDQILQNSDYSLYQGDRTFNSAVLYSLENKDQEAYYSLGYVLHLIEDMTVPAHTRQDTHVDLSSLDFFSTFLGVKFDGGEPYEKWAQDDGEIDQDTMDYLKNNYQPICSSLENCLAYLAKYSNNSFFSQDSILAEEYRAPLIYNWKDLLDGGKTFRYYYGEGNNLLFRSEINSITKNLGNGTVNLDNINQAYWDRLSPAAILAGVEVVKYFHDQVKKAENKEITLERPKKIGFFQKIKTLSPYGEIVRLSKYASLSFINPFLSWGYDDQQGDGQPKTQSTNLLTDLEITPENAQERMDDLQELIDLLNGGKEDVNPFAPPSFEIPSLLAIETPSLDLPQIRMELEPPQPDVIELPQIDPIELPLLDPIPLLQPQTPVAVVYSGGGGGSNPVYPKILISEIQILPIAQRFVELYNPNDQEINLTNWYIQRKTSSSTSWDSFVSAPKFEGKIIPAKGYFLISREIENSDIILDITISDNNSLVFKNPNREVSDTLGFGQAADFEGVSTQNPVSGKVLGRKWISNTEQDTDNNFTDFEEQNPTPKLQNIMPSTTIPTPMPEPEPQPEPTPTDTKAPTVVFNLPTEQQNLIFDVAFNITDLSIENVSPSGLQVFQFRWKEGEEGDWQEDIPVDITELSASFDALRNFSGSDEKTYYFQAKAKDVNNNESEWLPEDPASTWIRTPKTVLINEIQIDSIDGTGGTDDDWVELYNPYDVDVSLKGWSLQKHSKDDPCSTSVAFKKISFSADAVIPSNGYFLIIRNDANQQLLDSADMKSSYLQLSADNTIYLVSNVEAIENGDDPDIIDKVGFGSVACFPEILSAPDPGAKSIERKITGIDTNNNADDFIISDTATPKGNPPIVTIQDATEYSSCMGASNPGGMYCNLLIKWQSPGFNIDYYQVQYNKNNEPWQDWFANTKDTEGTFLANYNPFSDKILSFRVRGKNMSGNVGDWSEIEVDLKNQVVINEVGLRGTNAEPNSKGQWIELYNKSDLDVDLTGWKLVSQFGSLHLNQILSGIIPSHGYFILERDNDNVISNSSANQIFSGIINSEGKFYLQAPNERIVDEFYIKSGGWRENDFIIDGNYYSLERISPFTFGRDKNNWKLNNGIIKNGLDKDTNPIYGTPGQQNSNYQIYSPIGLDIIEDTILKKDLSPYFVSDIVYIFPSVTLTIEPGVVIKFKDLGAGMEIKGTLKAIGDSSNQIVFTSNSLIPTGGMWSGINFTSESKDSELEYMTVQYGGDGYTSAGFKAGIKVSDSSISIKNSIINENSNSGIWLINSDSLVDSVQISEHRWTTFSRTDAVGIKIKEGNPTIQNCSFVHNYYGITETNSSVGAFPARFLGSNSFINNDVDIWPSPPPPPPLPPS